MSKKPISLRAIPLFLLAIACSFYFQVAFLLDFNTTHFIQILQHIPLVNWITIFLLIGNAFAIYKGHRLTKLLTPLSIACVFWNNYLVGQYQENKWTYDTLLSASLFPLVYTPLLTRNMRSIFSNKRHQWWQTAKRKSITTNVAVNPFAGPTFVTRTFDVSKTGLFICLDEEEWQSLPKIGERVKLNITIDTLRKVRCEAIIVRLEEPKGAYPRGMGLRFTSVSKESKRTLQTLLNH
jgi:hypothetical protein